jgi:hypothetical protein
MQPAIQKLVEASPGQDSKMQRDAERVWNRETERGGPGKLQGETEPEGADRAKQETHEMAASPAPQRSLQHPKG